MPHPSDTLSAMDQLLVTLDLERLEENLFRGMSPQIGWQRVFGGQVIAQSLMAAQRTTDSDRFVHSLHAYFMLPGDPKVPIIYDVERLRDGSSFSTRRVTAIQHGRAIFAMSASFHVEEPGFDHQTDMPPVRQPEELMSEEEFQAMFLAQAPEMVKRYWGQKRPVEIRPLSLVHYVSNEKLKPEQKIWVRMTGAVPDDRHYQAAALAYLSDMTLLDTSLYAHGTTIFNPEIQAASIDHAMWFHRPCALDDWLLYTQDSPSASGARGMTRGGLYTRCGMLIASVAQEGLIRKRATEQ
ncbi:acyl-CoA thioesterase II [Rhizobium oryzicola]|uniref:Acyl-CoA thioesterase II n=1 Tax=Rhizobium oryzicola TaxID=1232668 RepID=A0ABT8T5S5_9HYPH|nr:acyl-CoA thioesterase II [Rhizobium oryzicola]MDO1585142.1 acyl-CoA thioesterase II [Rhizobium oryzicola]